MASGGGIKAKKGAGMTPGFSCGRGIQFFTLPQPHKSIVRLTQEEHLGNGTKGHSILNNESQSGKNIESPQTVTCSKEEGEIF